MPNQDRTYRNFLISVTFNLLLMVTLEYRWMIGGEMWAEMATNYFHYAQSGNWREWLLATDAGYVPLPQRLLAVTATWLHLPVAAIPHFYTWTSAALSSIVLSMFALKDFRALVARDDLRLLTCLFLCIVLDFETRTFVNFTYLGALLIALVSAKVLAAPEEKVPLWCWLIPVLIASKPSVLSALPVAILAAWHAPGRYRRIVIVTTLVALLQLLQLKYSQEAGVMPMQSAQSTWPMRAWLTVTYSLGYLAQSAAGPVLAKAAGALHKAILPLMGLILAIWLTRLYRKSTDPARHLVLAGGSMLGASILLNCVALSAEWTPDLHMLPAPRVFRRVLVAHWGGMLVMIGTWVMLTQQARPGSWLKSDKHFLRTPILWFILTGWIIVGLHATRAPNAPVLNNSSWQAHSIAIANAQRPLCLPVDPFGWGIYGQSCELINLGQVMDNAADYVPTDGHVVTLTLPQSVQGRHIKALSILIQPVDGQTTHINAKIRGASTDGQTDIELTGTREVLRHGSMLLLETPPGKTLLAREPLTIEFNQPVRVKANKSQQPLVMWMGPPREKVSFGRHP